MRRISMNLWPIVVLSTLLSVGCTAETTTALDPNRCTLCPSPIAAAAVGSPGPVLSGLLGPCIQGPELRVGDLTWLVAVPADDLVLATSHSAAPGCQPTADHPRNPGALSVTAEGQNTRIRWQEQGYGSWETAPCGRVQVDIESRQLGLLVGVVLNYGTVCSAPPPPPPACVDAVPSAGLTFPVGGVGGSATVTGTGLWTLALLAADTADQYPGRPVYLKAVDTVRLICGQTGTLSVTYDWTGHGSRYWWIAASRDGMAVGHSAWAVRP